MLWSTESLTDHFSLDYQELELIGKRTESGTTRKQKGRKEATPRTESSDEIKMEHIPEEYAVEVASHVDEVHSKGQTVTAQKINKFLFNLHGFTVHQMTVGCLMNKMGLLWAPIWGPICGSYGPHMTRI